MAVQARSEAVDESDCVKGQTAEFYFERLLPRANCHRTGAVADTLGHADEQRAFRVQLVFRHFLAMAPMNTCVTSSHINSKLDPVGAGSGTRQQAPGP